MIRIENLSVDFTAPDEAFARRLYADWDDFCHDCVERVLDECLSPRDREKTMYSIDRIDLDLGSIPEEDFYREFPERLREELLKNIPLWNLPGAQTGGQSDAMHRNVLLHYLEYGYPPEGWTDTDFSLEAELKQLSEQSAAASRPIVEKTAQLCLKQEHALRRFLWQADNEDILLQVFVSALTEPSAGQSEKRRLLVLLLETRPGIPLQFVHGTDSDTRLREMSCLLDTLSVRQIIRTETKEHAEVDLPSYWHCLYEWLIRYYPYNGTAMFGDKAEFTRHMNHRLLTFIHKRNGSPYLSKEELTMSFLLEVFGPVYYKDMLNAIYRLQPHNPDGSPVYDNYFNRELYRILRLLSLLRQPETSRKKEKAKEWLRQLRSLPEEDKTSAVQETMMPVEDILQAVAGENFYQAVVLSKTMERLQRLTDSLPLSLTHGHIPPDILLRKALLAYLQDPDTTGRTLTEKEITGKFLRYLRIAATGKDRDDTDDIRWQLLAETVTGTGEDHADALPAVETLADKSLPETIRKRLFLRYIRLQPGKLAAYLREVTLRNTLIPDEWLRWTEASDWLHIAASLSPAKAELLLQTADILSLPDEERKKTFATYILSSDTEEWPYVTAGETVRSFIGSLPSMQKAETGKKEETVHRVEKELALTETEIPVARKQSEALTTGNAGLCLLTPWLVRLCAMLGYLDEERKEFRSTASKVRTVFLLQYLVYGKEKEWREADLTFNRLLTALPGYVPLPRKLALTDEEKQTADSMVAGVKANWPQMDGTSVEGFRSSFLARNGLLEEEEEHHLLTVEEKAYDILLETVPWGFRQIRLPWLKKYVQVKWHEKQIF